MLLGDKKERKGHSIREIQAYFALRERLEAAEGPKSCHGPNVRTW